jgi:diguanylate cyclase (GGDEF)-like protein
MLTLSMTNATQFLSGSRLSAGLNDRPQAMVRIHPASGVGELVELIDGCLTIGRDADCDIHLPDDSVSRRHAQFDMTGDDCVVEDLGSTNGVYVNDRRVKRQSLLPGDRVRFGNQIFRFLGGDHIETEYFETAYRMMTTDGLTQAHNKRFLLEMLERELSRTRRMEHPLSLIMIDVDHFKSVNDKHGHLAGDEVLCELCRRARTILRAGDVLARFGGEEFTLVLPETAIAEATIVGERLRAEVAETPFATELVAIPVTISLGISSTTGADHVTVDDLLSRADALLYNAKQSGRNRLCF